MEFFKDIPTFLSNTPIRPFQEMNSFPLLFSLHDECKSEDRVPYGGHEHDQELKKDIHEWLRKGLLHPIVSIMSENHVPYWDYQ